MPEYKRSKRALADLKSIVSYIAADNPLAADRWLNELEHVFKLLAAHPESSERVETCRYGVVRRHTHGNYVIYYRPRSYGVFVLRVLHGARDKGRIL